MGVCYRRLNKMLTCRLDQNQESLAAAKRSFKFKKVHVRAQIMIRELFENATGPLQASDV